MSKVAKEKYHLFKKVNDAILSKSGPSKYFVM